METTVSAHLITNDKEFSFDPTIYSKFKYGCVSSTIAMAKELAAKFLDYDMKYNIIDQDTEIVIVPAAYRTIPSAAAYLADNFRTILNWWLHNNDFKPAIISKVHRETTYEGDYGRLTQQEREEVLKQEYLSINPDSIEGKTILFIDDIKVTGTHENLVNSMMIDYDNPHLFLYYAEVKNFGISADIENFLNRYAIGPVDNNVFHLIEILEGKHYLSARMVKEILRMDEAPFNKFLGASSNIELFINLVNQSIAEGYDKLPTFKHNFNHLKTIVKHEFHKSAETASH